MTDHPISDISSRNDSRTTHDLAYLCFLPTTLISVVSGILKFIPVDTGTAGGVGFLILIPLALLALVSVPTGIVLSLRYRQDRALLLLSFLTVLYVLEIISEAGSTKFYNTSLSIYGILSILVLATWFLYRRKSFSVK